jgi:hypothetical protein
MAQTRVGAEHMNKCGHEGCLCVVEPSQTYCSDYCVKVSGADASNQLPARQIQGDQCQCGHPACQH